MKQILFILTFFLNQYICLAQTNYKKQNDSAEVFIQQTIKDLNVSGLAVAVIKDGKVLKMSCYGKANYDWNLKIDAHTNFQIASTTKLLTSTLVMKSLYNKKFALDDLVSNYVENAPNSWQGMKIRHLLNHTSGIRDFKGDRYTSTDKVVNSLKDSTLAYPTGTKQAYMSGDFTILLHILEKIYKMPYPEILRTEITNPLRMKDGAFDRERMVSEWMETDSVHNKASTYYVKNGKRIPYKFFYPQFTYTAGGYFASLTDLVNWAIGIDEEILFPSVFEKSIAYKADTVGTTKSGFSQIGLSIGDFNGMRFGGHSGGPALGDVLRFPDEKITIIILSNDGELLPYFAPAILTFYVPGLFFERKVTKFKRTQALK
ncbi:serine hydrolase domain-containing protein [Pedobacter frigoris]|uniref:Beta-lactamase family protein n=1 Tax=Pedobacter frigoris TaxID=2571272 RepID=A0A4U1CKV6_9SPHI|nr:serine hydrolase domain-containing protein [Pedobacter frigoris]TKC07472.1 beta-lactamase family protein [Pedobacter frigoris]